MVALPGGEVGGVLVLPVAAAVAAVLAWLALLAFVLVATRPRAGRAAAPTQDLGGDEPPAVVSYVTAGWTVTEDAVESTLLDLAARDYLEFRQLSDEPRATTVHLVDPATRRAGGPPLTPYEESVLGRVAAVAVDGMAPVTALTFRDAGAADSWWSAFRKAVVAEARERGLSRRRVSPAVVAGLSTAALVPGLAVFGAVLAQRQRDLEFAGGLGIVTFVLLSSLAARPLGDRDTPLGREVAGRWLGLRRYLEVDEAFRDLPPAAVAVWDRYLAYGDALGMTRVCAAVLDLGLGDREQVWSSYGGTWHQVKVRYPSASARFGGTVPRLLGGAVPALAVSFVALTIGGAQDGLDGVTRTLAGIAPEDATGRHLDPWGLLLPAILLLGAGSLAWAVHRVVRTALGALSPVTFEGEVLWLAVARNDVRGEHNEIKIPVIYYLAVDDGTVTSKGHRTTAWALPAEMSSACTPGDVVQVTARPYSRRVTGVQVRSHRSVDAVVVPAQARGASPLDVDTRPSPAVGVAPSAVQALQGLVATALGTAAGELGVRGTGNAAAAGVVFDVSQDARTVPAVTLATASGVEGDLLLASSRSGGEAMSGVGDEAWSGPGWAVARQGDLTVRLSLSPQVRDRAERHLPVLLASALETLAPSNGHVSTRD